MKIIFDHIDLSFENVDGNDERLKRISHLIWKLLDERFETKDDNNNNAALSGNNNNSNNNNNFSSDGINKKANGVTLREVAVPPIRIDSTRSDYEIASRCASAIHQAVLAKLQ